MHLQVGKGPIDTKSVADYILSYEIINLFLSNIVEKFWQKEKLLIKSNFSFCQNVFNSGLQLGIG